jgi:HNH endonuclease
VVSVDHVDVFDRALRRLDGVQREQLLGQAAGLVEGACGRRPEDFERSVKAAVAVIETEPDREARLLRQRGAARFRSWVDRESGMWRCFGEFDPDTGRRLQSRLDAELRAVFAAGSHADEGPDDPVERNGWLFAQAAARVMLGVGKRSVGKPEIVAVVRADGDGRQTVDWGLPVELPRVVFDDLFGDRDTIVTGVVVRDGIVVHAPGALNLGYTTRLANRDQRRALRALHSTCAAGGCHVGFDQCKVHHIIWWRHGGPTDLWNLIPLCWRHHADVHAGTLVLPLPNAPPEWRPP